VELSEHVVLIGAYGWQHKGWSGTFYPEDLPEEWQLGYYGNEFQLVVVPASYWEVKADTFDEWLEESDESLKMICEWPAEGAMPAQITQAQQGIAAVSDRVVSILIPLASEVDDSQITIYKELAEKYPLCFELSSDQAPDLEPKQRESLLRWLAENFADDDYGVTWRTDPIHKTDLALGSVSLTRISGEVAPKQLREVLETILAASGENRSLMLIVDGEPPSMQLLENTGTILDLL